MRRLENGRFLFLNVLAAAVVSGAVFGRRLDAGVRQAAVLVVGQGDDGRRGSEAGGDRVLRRHDQPVTPAQSEGTRAAVVGPLLVTASHLVRVISGKGSVDVAVVLSVVVARWAFVWFVVVVFGAGKHWQGGLWVTPAPELALLVHGLIPVMTVRVLLTYFLSFRMVRRSENMITMLSG